MLTCYVMRQLTQLKITLNTLSFQTEKEGSAAPDTLCRTVSGGG